MSRYFRRYYEAADDSGAAAEEAPVEETPDEPVDEPEAPPAAPTFGVEDIASGLGSRFQERFLAHHEPAAAIAEYGKSVEHLQSAYGRLSQGGEPTDEDIAAAEALGIELPQPAEEQVEPLWGAPWAEPTTYDEIAQLATQDPARAMEFIDRQPDGRIDPGFRQQVLAWWANPEGGADPVAMTAYLAQYSETRAETRAREAMEQMREEIRQEFGDVRAKHNTDVVEALHNKESLMTTRAKAEIPNFDEYAEGVTQLMQENIAQDPDYATRLFALSVDDQLRHISDLTGVAAWRAQFHAEATKETEAAAATAAKEGAAGERGRGAASQPGNASAQSAMKKKFTDDIRRAVENPA